VEDANEEEEDGTMRDSDIRNCNRKSRIYISRICILVVYFLLYQTELDS
jgi:hypothetical protein